MMSEFVFLAKDDKYMYFEVFHGNKAMGTVYLKYLKSKGAPQLQPHPYQSMVSDQEAHE